jgi:hypothetical protein
VEADGRCRIMVATATESFPLASAAYVIDSSIRVYGVLYGHDERWFPYPSFIWRRVRGAHCHKNDRRPRLGRVGLQPQR